MTPNLDAKEVKRIRIKFRLSQEDFARLFGFSGSASVSNIETGFRKPGPTLIIMLRFLDSLSIKEAKKFLVKLRQNELLNGSSSRAQT